MPSQTSSILGLPLIQPAQAQKHVTHNEALRLLDLLVQLSVASRARLGAPGDAPDGTRYIVPAGATGVWAGQTGAIALRENGAWSFIAPRESWRAFVENENAEVIYDGTDWVLSAGGGAVTQTDLLGINATASATNRLSVASEAALFSHDGTDHRLKVNKASITDTASLLFQSGFTGLAEMGLTGSNAFSLRVSPNGSGWQTALTVNGTTARPEAPQGMQIDGALTGSAVVGNVSQSGGVSSGAVIESGENANGAYTRWADGTQICTGSGPSSSSSDTVWTYPAVFSDTTNLVILASYMGSGNGFYATTRAPGPASVGYNVWSPSHARATSSAGLVAIGRWY